MHNRRPSLIAAIIGAVIFASVTGAVIIADHYVGGPAESLRVNLTQALMFVIWIPAMLMRAVIVPDAPISGNFISSNAFAVLVNGILGAVVFSCVAGIWHRLKKANENDHF